jgi:threonine aldolase
LADDHANAKRFAERVNQLPGIHVEIDTVESNLVSFELDLELGTGDQLIAALAQRGVLMLALGPQRIRACTHLDVTKEDIDQAADALEQGLDNAATEPAPHPYAYR